MKNNFLDLFLIKYYTKNFKIFFVSLIFTQNIIQKTIKNI